MSGALIGRGFNYFNDIHITSEVLFDNFELIENNQLTDDPTDNTWEINTNGVNIFSIDQSGNVVITGSLTAPALVTARIQDADNTTSIAVEDTAETIDFTTTSTLRGQFKPAGDLNLITGNAYQINDTDVLTTDTLGGGIFDSSLKTLGVLTALTVDAEILTKGINNE